MGRNLQAKINKHASMFPQTQIIMVSSTRRHLMFVKRMKEGLCQNDNVNQQKLLATCYTVILKLFFPQSSAS